MRLAGVVPLAVVKDMVGAATEDFWTRKYNYHSLCLRGLFFEKPQKFVSSMTNLW